MDAAWDIEKQPLANVPPNALVRYPQAKRHSNVGAMRKDFERRGAIAEILRGRSCPALPAKPMLRRASRLACCSFHPLACYGRSWSMNPAPNGRLTTTSSSPERFLKLDGRTVETRADQRHDRALRRGATG